MIYLHIFETRIHAMNAFKHLKNQSSRDPYIQTRQVDLSISDNFHNIKHVFMSRFDVENGMARGMKLERVFLNCYIDKDTVGSVLLPAMYDATDKRRFEFDRSRNKYKK